MKIKSIGIAACLALGIVGLASGATISWSSSVAATEGGYGENLSAGLFSTNGALVYAENVGGEAYTFDSIAFEAGTTVFAGTTNVYHDDPASFETELSATGTTGTNGADTVTLTGLTIGTNYVIQALVYDGRGDGDSPGRTVEFDGIDQGQYANGEKFVTWGDGLLVTGTFTADATTQDFTVEAFLGTDSKGGQLNAFTLFDPNGIFVPPLGPAPITWTSAPAPIDQTDPLLGILQPGLFDVSGALVLAENVGGPASSFDGIDFAEGTIMFDATYDGFNGASGTEISKSATYGSAEETVTLTGLTSNQEYRVQALVYDSRTAFFGRTVEFDGVDQGQYANGVDSTTAGDGLLVTGTFTANAETQPFTIEAFLGTDSKGGQLNAITVYGIVPAEPVTVSITGPVSGGSEMEISWVGVAGGTYSVETNANLIIGGGWGSFATNIYSSGGGLIVITNAIDGDQTFYRVITE